MWKGNMFEIFFVCCDCTIFRGYQPRPEAGGPKLERTA